MLPGVRDEVLNKTAAFPTQGDRTPNQPALRAIASITLTSSLEGSSESIEQRIVGMLMNIYLIG